MKATKSWSYASQILTLLFIMFIASLTAILGGYLNALSNYAFFSVLLLISFAALMIFLNLSRAHTLKAA